MEGRTVVIFNNKFLGGIKELQLLISTKYIYYLMHDNRKLVIDEFAKFVKSSGVSRLFKSFISCHLRAFRTGDAIDRQNPLPKYKHKMCSIKVKTTYRIDFFLFPLLNSPSAPRNMASCDTQNF